MTVLNIPKLRLIQKLFFKIFEIVCSDAAISIFEKSPKYRYEGIFKDLDICLVNICSDSNNKPKQYSEKFCLKIVKFGSFCPKIPLSVAFNAISRGFSRVRPPLKVVIY